MNQRFFLSMVLMFLGCSAGDAVDTNRNYGVWEKEIRAYEQSDKTNPPPRNAVLFVGSSGIRLWTSLAKDFPDHKVINRGFGGCEIVDCTYFAERIVFPYEPKMIVFRCGGNDLANGKSPEQVFADFKEFVATVHARLPKTEIVFISWNPTIARWENAEKEKAFNQSVKDYCRETPLLKYVEAFDMVLDENGQPRAALLDKDKLHFSPKGYEALVERVRPLLPKN